MTRTCEGCRVEVFLDWRTGRLRAADGSAGTATFSDSALVVWECPSCGYPQADEVVGPGADLATPA